jgi:hypothetical protein
VQPPKKQFEVESNYQIEIEEEIGDVLIIIKYKTDKYKNILANVERKRQE